MGEGWCAVKWQRTQDGYQARDGLDEPWTIRGVCSRLSAGTPRPYAWVWGGWLGGGRERTLAEAKRAVERLASRHDRYAAYRAAGYELRSHPSETGRTGRGWYAPDGTQMTREQAVKIAGDPGAR